MAIRLTSDDIQTTTQAGDIMLYSSNQIVIFYDSNSWLTISPNPTDTNTLIPFLKDMEEHLNFKYRDIVADAGYESEENYLFIEENGQAAFIKPANYEI